jgi:hypothetical protein
VPATISNADLLCQALFEGSGGNLAKLCHFVADFTLRTDCSITNLTFLNKAKGKTNSGFFRLRAAILQPTPPGGLQENAQSTDA